MSTEKGERDTQRLDEKRDRQTATEREEKDAYGLWLMASTMPASALIETSNCDGRPRCRPCLPLCVSKSKTDKTVKRQSQIT